MFTGLLFGTELFFIPIAILAIAVFTGDITRRLVALQMIGTLGTLMFALLSIVFAQPSFVELAIVAALLGSGAAITYAHFLERWL